MTDDDLTTMRKAMGLSRSHRSLESILTDLVEADLDASEPEMSAVERVERLIVRTRD
jgi:hypothetical protein